MLKIRLKRGGRGDRPIYKIVTMRSNTSRDGLVINNLGFYNPITKEIKLNILGIIKNLKHGAQPTKTIKNLLIKIKILKI